MMQSLSAILGIPSTSLLKYHISLRFVSDWMFVCTSFSSLKQFSCLVQYLPYDGHLANPCLINTLKSQPQGAPINNKIYLQALKLSNETTEPFWKGEIYCNYIIQADLKNWGEFSGFRLNN